MGELLTLLQKDAGTEPVHDINHHSLLKNSEEKISERVRVEMTVVLLTGASRCKSASLCISAINPVELLVRYN
jgi:hypothetical protein